MLRPLIVLLTLAWPLSALAHLGVQRDLEALMQDAPVVVRATVLGCKGSDRQDDPVMLELKVAKALKGAAEGTLRVRGEGHHALRADVGEQGLFFLAPSKAVAGELACMQSEGERWTVEPGSEEATDALAQTLAKKDLPPAEKVEAFFTALHNANRRVAAFGIRRLAIGARELTADQRQKLEASVVDETIPDATRAALVAAVGGVIPVERAIELAKSVPDSSTRAALLELTGQQARTDEVVEAARSVLGAARGSDSPEVALAAAMGLAELGDEAALPVFAKALEGNNADRRSTATLGLARLAAKGSRAAKTELLNLSKDRDPVVRIRAQSALEKLKLEDPLHRSRTRVGLYVAMAGVLMLIALGAALLWGNRRSAAA